MHDNGKSVKKYLCPACFAREIDVLLAYDEEAEEYYCKKCCYAVSVLGWEPYEVDISEYLMYEDGDVRFVKSGFSGKAFLEVY